MENAELQRWLGNGAIIVACLLSAGMVTGAVVETHGAKAPISDAVVLSPAPAAAAAKDSTLEPMMPTPAPIPYANNANLRQAQPTNGITRQQTQNRNQPQQGRQNGQQNTRTLAQQTGQQQNGRGRGAGQTLANGRTRGNPGQAGQMGQADMQQQDFSQQDVSPADDGGGGD